MGYSNHYVCFKNEKGEKKSWNEEKIKIRNRIKKMQNKFLDNLHLLKFPKKKSLKKKIIKLQNYYRKIQRKLEPN